VPKDGDKITVNADLSLNVTNHPVIPIEGDGIGSDITPVMMKVVNSAVQKAYSSKRSIVWMEVFCGEKATRIYGPDNWLPHETLEALRGILGQHQGPADYAGGRGLPVAERCPAPGSGPVCVHPPGALV